MSKTYKSFNVPNADSGGSSQVNELPKFLVEDPDDNTHAIIVNDPMNPNEALIIPLVLKGFTSYFSSRKPIASEYEDESILHIDITSEAPVW